MTISSHKQGVGRIFEAGEKTSVHEHPNTPLGDLQRFGYVAGGVSAAPDDELRYILQVRDQYYGFLANVPVPVSEVNHKLSGVSSTPTVVVVDRQGIVKLYHPGGMAREELEQQLLPLLGSSSTKARK